MLHETKKHGILRRNTVQEEASMAGTIRLQPVTTTQKKSITTARMGERRVVMLLLNHFFLRNDYEYHHIEVGNGCQVGFLH
jgi:hypothetical protein